MSLYYVTANDVKDPSYRSLKAPDNRLNETPQDSSRESLYTYNNNITPGNYAPNKRTIPYHHRENPGHFPLDTRDPYLDQGNPRSSPFVSIEPESRRSPDVPLVSQDPYSANRYSPKNSPVIQRDPYLNRSPQKSSLVRRDSYPTQKSPQDSILVPDPNLNRKSPQNASLTRRDTYPSQKSKQDSSLALREPYRQRNLSDYCPLDSSGSRKSNSVPREQRWIPSELDSQTRNTYPKRDIPDEPSRDSSRSPLDSRAELNRGYDQASMSNDKSGSLTILNASPITTTPAKVFDIREVSKEGKKKCCSYRVLIVLLIFLAIFAVIMMALFIWRMSCCNGEETSQGEKTQTSKTKPPQPTGCKVKPYPIKFTTLPKSIQDEMQKLQTFIQNGIKSNKATAVTANVVYRDTVIWSGGFGVMNKSASNPRAPNPQTMFPCASVTKVLTALIMFKQYNDGRVSSLDGAVVQYGHTFSIKNPFNSHKITLKELATQRSGLQREAPCYPETATNLCPYDHATMLQRISNLTLVNKPGTIPQYSNFAYALLGEVLLKSFGSGSFGQWITANLLTRLGMTDSYFVVTNSQKQNMPVGYTSNTAYSKILEWGWLTPAGGLFSSVTDLAKLEVELMSDKDTNRYLSKPITEQLFRPAYIFSDGKRMVGTPWEMEFYDGYLIREKGGYIFGYSSYVAMVPELRLGFNFMCTNCDNSRLGLSLQKYFRTIITLFHDALTNATLKTFVDPPDSKPFLGRYNSTIPTINLMEVQLVRDKLVLAVNGFGVFFLNYTMPLTFKIAFNPVMDCNSVYLMGVYNDVVIFDKPSVSDGLSHGFIMYGAHPSGKAYFSRA